MAEPTRRRSDKFLIRWVVPVVIGFASVAVFQLLYSLGGMRKLVVKYDVVDTAWYRCEHPEEDSQRQPGWFQYGVEIRGGEPTFYYHCEVSHLDRYDSCPEPEPVKCPTCEVCNRCEPCKTCVAVRIIKKKSTPIPKPVIETPPEQPEPIIEPIPEPIPETTTDIMPIPVVQEPFTPTAEGAQL